MFASFVVLCISVLVCSSQSVTNNSSSSTITNERCFNNELPTIWFDVNTNRNTLTQDANSTYLALLRIANTYTCTAPVDIQTETFADRIGTLEIQQALPESNAFTAFVSLYSLQSKGSNSRVQYCRRMNTIASTTMITKIASTTRTTTSTTIPKTTLRITTTPKTTLRITTSRTIKTTSRALTTTTKTTLRTTTTTTKTTSRTTTRTASTTRTTATTTAKKGLMTSSDGAVCGKQEIKPRSSLTTRIFGGTDAIANSWPWMISYRQITTCGNAVCYILCGATLISKDYAITAAHCINTINPSDITLIAGMHNQTPSTAETNTRQVRTAQKIYVHPQYDASQHINDIALLRVSTSFTYTTYVQPACLPGAEPQPNDQIVIVGWGSEKLGGTIVNTLKQAYTTVVGDCNYYWSDVNEARQICIANSVSGDSACQGDSGGPILAQDNGQYVVSGVASYVYQCDTMGYDNAPNVYTRVSAYKAWIQSITG